MDRPLFGGALVGKLPADAQDMSIVREIPDNQEVFAHSLTDQSIIVEILEYVQETDQQALKTHFEDLASSNDAASSEHSCIMGVDELDKQILAFKDCSKAYWLMGQQRVSKYKEVARNDINVHLVLYRLPQFTTDIVLTFNDPVNVNPDSSSHQAVATGTVPLDSSSHHAVATGTVPWNVEDLRCLVHSLALLDTGLFDEGSA
ncbi:hypothetical protein ACOMHN_063119 [Nucella lapillus]